MGKSGAVESDGRIRHSKYLEEKHMILLNWEIDKIEELVDISPYSDYEELNIDLGFFGAGYTLASFPSLYDMYGKFMAGLDVEYIFNQSFADTTEGVIVHSMASDHADMLSYDLENTIIPRYEVGMRDINAVVSGTFVVGKAMLENKRTQELSKFLSELRYKMIPIAVERWRTHLDWNKEVIKTYGQILQLYIGAHQDVTGLTYEMRAKGALWPFTLYEYLRSALGALSGGGGVGPVAGSSPSTGSKMLGGGMAGAAAGAAITPITPWIGGVVGGVLGLASGLL